MKFKEYIYRYTYNILFYSDSGFGESVGDRGRSVGDPWRVRGGSVGDPWGIRGGSVGDPWRIRGGFGRFLKIPLFYGTFWPSGEYFGPLWGGLLH